MENVRKAERDGRDSQARPLILERARKNILQHATKQEFLRPRGEKQNADDFDWRRAQTRERRRIREEADAQARGRRR